MKAEPRVVTLGEVATVQSGFAFKSSQWTESGVPVVKIANVKSGRIDLGSNQSFVSEADAEKAARFRLKQGDIVIGMTGYVGEVAQVRTNEHLLLNQRVGLVQIDESKVDRQYLFHLMSGEAFRSEAKGLAYGSAQPNISPSLLQLIEIPLPPLEEQRAIAATLGALDDKIESNRRQISSLNRTGRSLYEAAIAENSISVPISTLVEHRPGKHLPKANYRPGSITVYGSNSVMGLHDTPLYGGPFAVMARIGSYCGSLHWTDEPAWVNNNASALLPLNGAPSWILRHALEAIDMSQFRVGTGQPFIAVKALMATALQMPAEGLQGGLNQDLRSISRLGSQRLREVDALQALRDALLPELLSGRIRAADVEVA